MSLANLKNKLGPSELSLTRLYYFFYMGGSGFINPFINLFYVSLGISGVQIGTLASASAIVGLVAAPIVTNEIKKRPNARSLLQVILLIGAVGYTLIANQTAFLPILVIIVLQSILLSSAAPLSDALGVGMAESTGVGYGSLRVFGSLGWIVMVPLSGFLVQKLGYWTGFGGFSLAWVITIIILFGISPRFFTSHGRTDLPQTGLQMAGRKILQNRALFGFAIALVAITFLNNGVQQFENVFLNDLGASKQLISIAGIMSALVELPFMVISDRIMRRIGAHRLLMIALVLTMFGRLAVLIFPSIVAIMIVRFLGGMGFSFYTVSYIGLIRGQTSTGETGTVLALYTVTLAGIVNVLASPISGLMYDAIGARWLYAMAAAGYGIATVSLWINRPRQISTNI